MKVLKDLDELVENQIITKEIADGILSYYQSKKVSPQKRLFIVFGILGAILVGLGINLIIAHNWDDFSRPVKAFFAFLPLVIGQLACVFVIIKKYKSTAWREGASAFLFFAVGASISLISQIYNIPGDLSSFLLTWALLTLPLIYVMNSSFTSLLFIAGITWYACETEYWTYPQREAWFYWGLLFAALPHYYLLYKNKPKSNFIAFHNWMVSLSVIICLGSLAGEYSELMFIAYMSLFGLLFLVGNFKHFKYQKLINNAFLIAGSLGTIILLLILSFDWFWDELSFSKLSSLNTLVSPEFIATVLISVLAIVLLIKELRTSDIRKINSLNWTFLVFILVFLIGLATEFAYVLINLLILTIGLLHVRKGAQKIIGNFKLWFIGNYHTHCLQVSTKYKFCYSWGVICWCRYRIFCDKLFND
ncbi:MAG: DUF2157 domain-containing protein [Chloroflexia bacterium]|nr:DUF2157 domain-containing protein [Chloroflexia bacterium]